SYQEREFRRREECASVAGLEHVNQVSVLRIHAGGEIREVPGRYLKAWVAGNSVVRIVIQELRPRLSQIMEFANIVRDHHASLRSGAPASSEEVFKVLAVRLNRKGHHGRVDAVWPEADCAPHATCPEGKVPPETLINQVNRR